jgi:hypothetical protein
MALHPPEQCVVHPLPLVPQFVGREAELDLLRTLWRDGIRGVVALVGLGGAGKTAIAARFLEELNRGEGLTRPAGLFVWSFYQEPDAGYFLQELHRYFNKSDQSSTPAKGAGLLHLLRDALESGERTCWCSTGWSVCNDKTGARPAFLDRSKNLCSGACCAESPTDLDTRSPW